ncbi:alpha/beta hydrolase [Ancylobacter sp. 6x-1]|uniref:Alpha/beta hydrolase n=1 Tax=Ancylobacter crimeensis TaxID=2579147 RepID=A0ABT0DEL9_9HYPH|nr:alpha/beta hydrolase [Ancylobacter crimeensis]MCK0198396.1 alpha/beta hydrolase [Ancylobacter crimeensis]
MLFATPANPVPEGAVCSRVRATDGVMLRVARWEPAVPAAGTICIFPGRTEKIEKYFETVENLRRRGFCVAVMDWRGQGGSDRLLRNPIKGHVGSFEHYQLDIDAFMRDWVLPTCPAPYFALAHSMGAAILLDCARLDGERQDRDWFTRMLLVAPMLDIALIRHPSIARGLARVLSTLQMQRVGVPSRRALHANLPPFEGNRLSSDPVRFARNAGISLEHPELDVSAPTIGWIRCAFDMMERLADPATARIIRQPLLLVGAGADTVVSTRAIERLGSRLIAGGHVVIPGARHELLQERDLYREQCLAAFDAFIPGSQAA